MLQRWVYWIFPMFARVLATGDYCAHDLCPDGLKHIACNNSGEYADLCPTDASLVNMEQQTDIILHLHNSKRNLIASGKLNGFDSAARMATVRWDWELARLAELNVKTCKFGHDICRNTRLFAESGQNIGIYKYFGYSVNNSALIKDIIDTWWNEYKSCSKKYLENFPRNYKGSVIGHFTEMAIDGNVAVGCAAIRFTKDKWNTLILTCNYAETNVVDQPIYEVGEPTSGCHSRTKNYKYKYLCSESEVYE